MSPRQEIIGDCRLILGDCREMLPTLDLVDAVVTDPPYHGVLADGWDNEWKSDDDFLVWVSEILGLIVPHLPNNGSLYWFTSPRMSAHVEIEISKRLRVLNNIVWDKSGGRKGAAGSGVEVGALRHFWSANTERLIFAEQYAADESANVFGRYLRLQLERLTVSNKEIQKLFPSKTGGMTGCLSNWLLGFNIPTAEQYATLRARLNLSRPYEDLRCEYETSRRPFFVTANDEWGDVWPFKIERDRDHPAQKPLQLMQHIVKASSRASDVVVDPFMGSGSTGVACTRLGRRFIGIEIEARYFVIACRRIEAAQRQGDLIRDVYERPAALEPML